MGTSLFLFSFLLQKILPNFNFQQENLASWMIGARPRVGGGIRTEKLLRTEKVANGHHT
jgi:hypothetical protein